MQNVLVVFLGFKVYSKCCFGSCYYYDIFYVCFAVQKILTVEKFTVLSCWCKISNHVWKQ